MISVFKYIFIVSFIRKRASTLKRKEKEDEVLLRTISNSPFVLNPYALTKTSFYSSLSEGTVVPVARSYILCKFYNTSKSEF